MIISYGKRDNDDLFQYFGFVEKNNKFDKYVFNNIKEKINIINNNYIQLVSNKISIENITIDNNNNNNNNMKLVLINDFNKSILSMKEILKKINNSYDINIFIKYLIEMELNLFQKDIIIYYQSNEKNEIEDIYLKEKKSILVNILNNINNF